MMNSWQRQDWFSFFQAVGSVVAIFASGWIASYQGRAARKLAAEQKQQKDATIIAALRSIIVSLDEFATTIRRLLEETFDVEDATELLNSASFEAIESHFSYFPLHELPSETVIRIAVEARTTARLLRQSLENAIVYSQATFEQREEIRARLNAQHGNIKALLMDLHAG
jgi:hypothetical protein